MTKILRAFTAAAFLIAASPAVGQVLLLDLHQAVPMASALDNPCTPELESILFVGATELKQQVWLLANGNLRMQVMEHTVMDGEIPATPLAPAVKYAFFGSSGSDLEFASSLSLSLLSLKKVIREGGNDDFHSVLVMLFDPQSLKLDLRLEAVCEQP